jgi:hypothetical protein
VDTSDLHHPPLSRAQRRRRRRVSFLFDPDSVARVLGELPHLAGLIGDPHDEGERATALHGARKSARELFRVLGNTHYDHLAELLAAVDACVGAGFRQPELLRTRGRRPFVEGVAEIVVADHLRRLGFAIRGFDEAKENDTVPDVLATNGMHAFAVEVYCPRAWPNLDAYRQGLTDRVKHLDRALDYTFQIEHSQLEQFDADHRLLHLHPGVLDDGLEEETGLDAISRLLEQLDTALDSGCAAPAAEVELSALNMRTAVELESVARTESALPLRAGGISGPPLTAYRPEAMFKRNVAGVVSKLKKGQAPAVAGAVPVLAVEMSQSELTSELVERSFYRPHFLETIQVELGDLRGYGAVIFTEFSTWQQPLRTHFTVVEHDIIDPMTLQKAFPE